MRVAVYLNRASERFATSVEYEGYTTGVPDGFVELYSGSGKALVPMSRVLEMRVLGPFESVSDLPQDETVTAAHWHPVGDSAHAAPFGTIRVCRSCGCLVAGGPTACGRCAKERKAGDRVYGSEAGMTDEEFDNATSAAIAVVAGFAIAGTVNALCGWLRAGCRELNEGWLRYHLDAFAVKGGRGVRQPDTLRDRGSR